MELSVGAAGVLPPIMSSRTQAREPRVFQPSEKSEGIQLARSMRNHPVATTIEV